MSEMSAWWLRRTISGVRRGIEPTCRGRELDGVGKVEERKREKMIWETRSNNCA